MSNTKDHPATMGEAQTKRTAVIAGHVPSPRCHERAISGSRIIVLMGVSGAGKSTLGTALAKALHLPFIDGDDLHPPANVAKMARGEALGDVDRMPWLEAVRRAAVARVVGQVGEEESDDKETWRPGVVVACSALKKTYRAVLRGETSGAGASVPTYIVYLKGDREVLMARMLGRQGHFMKAGMLESQLATLESPEGEPGVVSVSVGVSTEVQVQTVADALRSWS